MTRAGERARSRGRAGSQCKIASITARSLAAQLPSAVYSFWVVRPMFARGVLAPRCTHVGLFSCMCVFLINWLRGVPILASGGVLLAVYWWLGVGGADGTARSTPRERVEFLLVAGAASVWAGGAFLRSSALIGGGRAEDPPLERGPIHRIRA